MAFETAERQVHCLVSMAIDKSRPINDNLISINKTVKTQIIYQTFGSIAGATTNGVSGRSASKRPHHSRKSRNPIRSSLFNVPPVVPADLSALSSSPLGLSLGVSASKDSATALSALSKRLRMQQGRTLQTFHPNLSHKVKSEYTDLSSKTFSRTLLGACVHCPP